ncbi:MAG: hypothetical protein LC650_04795, partial [Actinobacteria bacterium]|nr:hypothetical protein [Actinomycetota bacterium]
NPIVAASTKSMLKAINPAVQKAIRDLDGMRKKDTITAEGAAPAQAVSATMQSNFKFSMRGPRDGERVTVHLVDPTEMDIDDHVNANADSIKNVAVIAIYGDEELLMVYSERNNGWQFPSGRINKRASEMPWDAAKRVWAEQAQQPFVNLIPMIYYHDYGRGEPHTRIFMVGFQGPVTPYMGPGGTKDSVRIAMFRHKDGMFPRDMVPYAKNSFKRLRRVFIDVNRVYLEWNEKHAKSMPEAIADPPYVLDDRNW